MKVEYIALDELVPYERNNRKHSVTQVHRIANSIAEFGFNQPIVVDENNIILVGHARLEAAKKIGLDKAPVLKLRTLTETQKKAYRILDNKLQNDSEWDFESLEFELTQLEEMNFDLDGWGLGELRTQIEEVKEPSEIDPSAIETQFRIEISCMSEGHQREIYERLTSEGLSCRLLTL